MGKTATEIAKIIGKSAAGVYAELQRGYTGERTKDMRKLYRADTAQTRAQDNIARRGHRRAAT